MSSIAVKKDVVHIEREALKLFLASVENEFNNEFSFFSASVDYSARLPQLIIRENGKI
ncbi:MAG: hypothetical protein WA977_02455 [Halobacteriota archaeon]